MADGRTATAIDQVLRVAASAQIPPRSQARERLPRPERGREQVAARLHAFEDGADRPPVGPERRIVELVPRDGRRDRQAGGGTRRVGGDEGAVPPVLREVETRATIAAVLRPFPA